MRFLGLIVIAALFGLSLQAEFSVNYNMEAESTMQLTNVTPVVPTVLELQSGGYHFQITNVGLGGLPYFTLNGAPYYVLGSLNCSDGQNPVFNITAQSWYCGNFLGYSAATSAGTLAGLTCNTGDSVVYNLGTWDCDPETDVAASLTCTPGQTPKTTTPPTWGCAEDFDAVRSMNCPVGSVLQLNSSSQWACFSPSDANLLGSLTNNCTSPTFMLYRDGTWHCKPDIDTLGSLGCSAGQIIKYTSTGATCGTDADTLRDLNCPMGSTVVLNGTVSCIPAPLTNVAPPTLFVDGQLLATSATSNWVTQSTYFGSIASRATAPFKYPQGFVVIGYGFSLTRNPTIGTSVDANFNITVQLVSAGNNQVLQNLYLPAGATTAFLGTSVAFPPLSSGLNVLYSVKGLNSQQDIGITTTLVLSINNPV